MESWRERMRREAAEMHSSVRRALALAADEAVRVELERLSALPYFQNFTWLWAPALAKRNRVMFRPFILSAFDRASVDEFGHNMDAWKGETAAELEALLAECDAADDVELTKRLYSWKHETRKDRDAFWRKDLVARFRAATTPAARHLALAKVDLGAWPGIDPATALELWQIDHAAARKFILSHLPWGAKRTEWRRLLDVSRDSDPEFHFELYRKIVDEKTWRDDVLGLPKTADVAAELERRHPALWSFAAGPAFHALLEKHGEAAVPYVKRHASSISPRWFGAAEGKGLAQLLELANARGWVDLWAVLLRTAATRDLFDSEVRKLVRAKNRARLERLPGRGREAHGAGWSFSQTHTLTDDTACELYARYPELVRGPYRMHVTPSWNEWFPKLARAAIAAGDADVVDFLASRMAMHQYAGNTSHAAGVDVLVKHYEGLAEDAFVRRAATALSRMPAFGIWQYKLLVDNNALARLLFERSTERFLGDAAAVRDLLESPQIQVQLLAFRILGQDDPRAATVAAAHIDLLQATLFRRLRAASRKLAFAALRRSADHDEATARYLLGRMRDALDLPEKRYPVEELVGLIGWVLARWPALRSPSEQPVIYGATA